jgi:hypothetical protein
MKTFRSHYLAIGMLASVPGSALAVQNELNNSATAGATITSNSDGSQNGEAFIVNDAGEEVMSATGGGFTSISNSNDTILNYDADDNATGTFAIRSGGTDVLSANNAGNLTIGNSMTTNGIDNGSDGMTNAGAVGGVTTIDVSGAATLGNTLAVDTNGAGAGGTRLSMTDVAATTTSLNDNTVSTLNDAGYSVSHVDGTGTNSLTVATTQQAAIGVGTFDYGTTIVGGALVEGDLGVNGSIYALNPTANSGILVGNNGMTIDGATNTTTLVADSNDDRSDGGSELIMQESQASMLVYNQQTGVPHGLVITQTETVLSGGTNSTSLTLDDGGATFTNMPTGGPARVTGVANGTRRYDAVNYGQLKETYGGIASVAAMANIPDPAPGKAYSIGLGFGNFEGENAFALGGAARLSESVSLQASIGHSDDNHTVGAGVGFSW